MTTEDNQQKIIESAISMREEGKSLSEIFASFPEEQNEIEEMFATLDWISNEKNKIKPEKEILKRILKNIPALEISKASVTVPVPKRNISESRVITGKKNQDQNQNSTKFEWKVWFPMGALTAIFLLVGFTQFGENPVPEESVNFTGEMSKEMAFSTTDLNTTDDVLALFSSEFEAERAVLSDSVEDISFINSDSQEINDFSQSYDENKI